MPRGRRGSLERGEALDGERIPSRCPARASRRGCRAPLPVALRYGGGLYEGDTPKLQRDGGGALPRGERDTRDSLFPSRFTRVGGAGSANGHCDEIARFVDKNTVLLLEISEEELADEYKSLAEQYGMEAEQVKAALKDHNSCLLRKHGQVVCGKDFDQAFERAMFFEMACRIVVLSGGRHEVLSQEEIDDLETYILGKKP